MRVFLATCLLLTVCGCARTARQPPPKRPPDPPPIPARLPPDRQECERTLDHLLMLWDKSSAGVAPSWRAAFLDDCVAHASHQDLACTNQARSLEDLERCRTPGP